MSEFAPKKLDALLAVAILAIVCTLFGLSFFQ